MTDVIHIVLGTIVLYLICASPLIYLQYRDTKMRNRDRQVDRP